MRIVDVLYSLPTIILIAILLALFGRSVWLVIVTLGAISWPAIARITRGEVLRVKTELFVESARVLRSSLRFKGRTANFTHVLACPIWLIRGTSDSIFAKTSRMRHKRDTLLARGLR
jgi:ABC-type microcin C transport system permease subunit YejE